MYLDLITTCFVVIVTFTSVLFRSFLVCLKKIRCDLSFDLFLVPIRRPAKPVYSSSTVFR
jgi:hypothetical protein